MAIELYDISTFYASDLYYDVNSTGFLENLGDNTTFRIPNSNIYLLVLADECIWFLFEKNSLTPIRLSIEEVLERSDEKASNYILFNLNIFKN